METRAHHILIGLFTLAVVAAAIVFTLWLGKTGSDKRYDLYDIVFEEAVSGLSKGSGVEFNGIKVGEVASLRLDPNDPRRVLARVRVDSKAPVRADTRARLAMVGVTGISKIRLTSGKSGALSPPLRTTAKGTVPVIVAEPSPFSKLLEDGGDMVFNFNELLMQMRKLLSAENADNLGRTLRNLEQITGTIAAQRDEMAEALRQLTQASRQANTALTETTKMMAGANRLLDEQGRQTLESAQRSLAAFERSMLTVDKLVTDNRGQIGGGMRGLAELGPAIGELRLVLASLRQIVRRLEDRPADYLLGQEPTREFQP